MRKNFDAVAVMRNEVYELMYTEMMARSRINS